MDELHPPAEHLYRDHRITIRCAGNGYSARVTHVSGALLPANGLNGRPRATQAQCLEEARQFVDRYLAYLAGRGGWYN